MRKYVYIDESGDLGMNGSKYLVLAALIIDEPRDLDRIIKNMRRNKFKVELAGANEIKANKSSSEVILYALEKLNAVPGARIFYMVLEKKKMVSDFLKNNKHKLYNYVAGKLARNLPVGSMDVDIIIDRSKGRQVLQEDFNEYFTHKMKEKSVPNTTAITHGHSHCWSGLQFADLLAWSCFQKFEHNDSSYVDAIKLEQEVYHVW
jgi:hypothetical protein